MLESTQSALGSSDVDGSRTAVLLCTFNEAENLAALIPQIYSALPSVDVLVVDDNSPDGTAQTVRSFSRYAEGDALRSAPAIYLLQRSGKRGLGSATRDGLQWCLNRDYDFVINLDADGSHDPRSAQRMLDVCVAPEGHCDVAVGSRYIDGGGVGGWAWHRRLMSRMLNGYAKRLLRLPINDCSGSFRCYRTSQLRELDFERLTCPGYGFLEEILVALHRQGARLVEVPIEFRERASGHSKLSFADAWGAIKVIHRLALEHKPQL